MLAGHTRQASAPAAGKGVAAREMALDVSAFPAGLECGAIGLLRLGKSVPKLEWSSLHFTACRRAAPWLFWNRFRRTTDMAWALIQRS